MTYRANAYRLCTALFALLVVAAATVAPAHAQQAAPSRSRVVLQVSDADAAKWNIALNNAKNIQTDLGAANVDVEIVAYGPGIAMLKVDSVVGNRIDEALTAGVEGARLRKHDAQSRSSRRPTCSARSATCLPESSKIMQRQQQGCSMAGRSSAGR